MYNLLLLIEWSGAIVCISKVSVSGLTTTPTVLHVRVLYKAKATDDPQRINSPLVFAVQRAATLRTP